MSTPQPDVYGALFGPLPEGWRERKGLPPAPATDAETAAARTGGKPAGKAPPPRLPGAPASPWELSKGSWIAVAKRTIKEFSKDRVTSVSGGVTFFGLLSLFPALTALVSIYGRLADPQTILATLDTLNNFLPPSGVQLIADQIRSITSAPQAALSFAGIAALLIALYSANGGMKALIDALNVAWFKTESRGLIKLNLVSLVLTVGGLLLVALLIGVIAVVPALLQSLHLGPVVETLIAVLRWPLMAGVLLVALAVVYRYGPDKEDAEWQWISPGAVFAAVGLIVASMLFSWYAANFANYNKTYGSLGAAIAMMMWLWIASMVVMTGAELNSEVERQIKMENGVADPADEKAAEQVDQVSADKKEAAS